MKTLLFIALALAGMLPASIHALAFTSDPLSVDASAGRASLPDVMCAATPKCRAKTLDLRAVSTYTANAGGTLTGPSSIPSGVSCPSYAGHAVTKKVRDKPTSMLPNPYNSCDSLRFKISDDIGLHEFQQAYDTAMKFIDTCYNNMYAPYMFQEFSVALQPLAGSDTSLWIESRLWLESVLYLNTTNPDYFCACLDAIGGTFHSPSDTSESLYWKEQNRQLALARWEIQNTSCDTPFLQNQFYATRASQYESWRNDTTVPLDTTIPSLASLGYGLDTLLNRHLLYATVGGTFHGILSNATAAPNPVSTGTIISFGISKEAYVKIEVFDILGNRVSSAGFESLFEPGNKAVPISLQGLPSGTYFARIVTAYGEVQTVKLVKE